jgi:hypothetical protein
MLSVVINLKARFDDVDWLCHRSGNETSRDP